MQYKILDFGKSSMEKMITIAAMDGYELCSPLFSSHSTVVATMVREVKVTKESLPELIISDFKSEVGSIMVESYDGGVGLASGSDRRMIALKISDKVDEFTINTVRRYEIDKGTVEQILLSNAEELTWIEDEAP